jgi:serine/threonine protein kinase
VPYIIFELANGDIRNVLDRAIYFDAAWAFRTLHHVATGLSQLHKVGIAHLDMKPSNALEFGESGTKVSDLGTSVRRGTRCPHEDNPIAGDVAYAPPELQYQFIALCADAHKSSYVDRKIMCSDLRHLSCWQAGTTDWDVRMST